MPKPINNFMPADLEFQMFVLDEHADKLLDEGNDVIKLTIGVPELPTELLSKPVEIPFQGQWQLRW